MKKQIDFRLLGGVVCLLIMVPYQALSVQSSIQALANVVSSLTVTSANNLDFGDVTPGVNKSVDNQVSAMAGQWDVAGTGSAEVLLGFTALPTQLVSGGNVLNASYLASTGTVQATSIPIPNLAAGATTNLVGGALSIWIGGTVYPSANQPGGAYTATITLNVTLTGS